MWKNLDVNSEDSFPSLSLNERDWRFARVRELMRSKGLDCLLVAGLWTREQFHSYLANDQAGGYVVIPLKGEPVHLCPTAFVITTHLESINRGETPWIEDTRVGATAKGIVATIKELGYDRSTIGVVGLGGAGAFEGEGFIAYGTWTHVLENLPNANFVDITTPFAELVLIKSEEEIKVVRWAAGAGEASCQAMLDATRPGVLESKVAAAIMSVLYEYGAVLERGSFFIIHSGPNNPSWGAPTWLIRAERPRTLQAGDVVQTEIFPYYGPGGGRAQVQMCVALNPVHPVNAECARLARQSYEEGLKALRPGKTFAEVADAMAKPILEAGAWHLTPLIHTMAPMLAVGGRGVGLEQLPGIERYKGLQSLSITRHTLGDTVVQPNTIYELEPNVCRGKHRVNIGGAVLVTEEGAEELNELPNEMRVV
ncbi:MAG: aminopeptidase P family protein [Chloroflexi bacterium]|nr:aminopeptidase P family protein [Chloroflexota bacterium]